MLREKIEYRGCLDVFQLHMTPWIDSVRRENLNTGYIGKHLEIKQNHSSFKVITHGERFLFEFYLITLVSK